MKTYLMLIKTFHQIYHNHGRKDSESSKNTNVVDTGREPLIRNTAGHLPFDLQRLDWFRDRTRPDAMARVQEIYEIAHT